MLPLTSPVNTESVVITPVFESYERLPVAEIAERTELSVYNNPVPSVKSEISSVPKLNAADPFVCKTCPGVPSVIVFKSSNEDGILGVLVNDP